ncbi:hypothetical protein HIM_01612 [Hirsutella minnesotensis 3608]|nr:hypothetical protein HIM_01612 [Hirsutella minnesotensis 3608]
MKLLTMLVALAVLSEATVHQRLQDPRKKAERKQKFLDYKAEWKKQEQAQREQKARAKLDRTAARGKSGNEVVKPRGQGVAAGGKKAAWKASYQCEWVGKGSHCPSKCKSGWKVYQKDFEGCRNGQFKAYCCAVPSE